MTDKCWFVLRHTYHRPPSIPPQGIGQSTGPLCIGHVITNTQHLDIINPETGPVAYPPSMPVATGRAYDFRWNLTDGGHIDVSASVDAPIAAFVGANVGLNAGVVFRNAVDRCWEFERLETFFVNITQSYVDDTMETTEIESYVDKHKDWFVKNPPLYIVTGIMAGRKAKISENNSRERSANAGATAGISSIAGSSGNVDVSGRKEVSSSQKVGDFVFAVRLAKVTKGLLDRAWSWSTLSEGATFGVGEGSEERAESIKSQLEACGHEYKQIIGLESTTGETFIL
ncbi:hypothetical protein F5X98DRAFT_92740 [Xylaria grammica]|nr:hypothetical protein F5X98DRAFT_92740 [Xylaria grammica]